jgi:subtilisin family serine protease
MLKLQTPWKLLLTTLFFTVLVWTPQAVYAASLSQTQENQGERVRLLVKVDPATYATAQVSALPPTATDDSFLSQMGWQTIEVDAAAADQVMAELQATQGVVEVTPDYPLQLSWTPNDPGFAAGNQWALDKIGADVAWEFSSGRSIIVAVLDSGIDPNHPDLVGRVVPGYNFIDKNTNTTDLCGHGTHVSGIIAAETNNTVGMASVAHQAKIMPLKVIGDNCLGSYSRLMQSIIYAVDHGVRIISITSGGSYEHNGLHDAIKYARSKGVLVVVAAGNLGNTEPFYPGSFAESFTIAGTDFNDAKYDSSSFGQQIDMSAPATGIFSTYYDRDKGSTYAMMTGTSMAAPHVAGVAALILGIDPKLPLADLEKTLTSSAADLGDAGWDPIFGWGRLTAWRAVAAVSPAAGNVRLGHYRVPRLATLKGINFTTVSTRDSIQLKWTQASVAADHSVVIYRSIVPVFDAATDIAEVAAATAGTYNDTDVEIDREYFYWLVQADNGVEVATSAMLNAKISSAPKQVEKFALFMPALQR